MKKTVGFMTLSRSFVFALTFLVDSAYSGPITSVGAVRALDDFGELRGILGIDTFDTRRDAGITFHGNALSDILPGVTTATESNSLPIISSRTTWTGQNGPVPIFPGPVTGGGVQEGNVAFLAGVATFQGTVTQFGLTAGKNGPQYLTAWDRTGAIIGQVEWDSGAGGDPESLAPSGFVGIDSLGVPIAMVSYGNHDLFSGQAFGLDGTTNVSDTWVWASGHQNTVPEPSSLILIVFGIAFLLIQQFQQSDRSDLWCRKLASVSRQ